MEYLLLNGNDFKTMDDLHEYIKCKLHFPEYYGKNLDALFDSLCDIDYDITIEFINFNKFSKVYDCFIDANKINRKINILI